MRYTAALPLQYKVTAEAVGSHEYSQGPRLMSISSPLKRMMSARIVATPSIITYQNLAAPTEIPPRAAVAAEQQHDASEHAHDPAQHASDAREEAAPIFPVPLFDEANV